MTHEEIREFLGVYALDAVDPDERIVVDRHLRECARCRAEVQDHRETAAMLAHTGGDAPDGVWQRIADSLEAPPPGLRLVPVDAAGPRRSRRLPQVMLAALAAAALVVAVLVIQVRHQERRIDELQTALHDPLTQVFQAALADPDSEVFELSSADGRTTLRGVVTADGTGYLRASSLPRLARDRTYQLWGAAGDRLISLGVMGPRPGIVSFRAEPYSTFAITEEVGAGVVVTTNHPIVAGGTA